MKMLPAGPPLVFVDTNIYLDFYRLSQHSRREFLKALEDNLTSLIVTEQVKMEFLKNRHQVMQKEFDQVKHVKLPQPAAYLAEQRVTASKEAADEKCKKYIETMRKRLEETMCQPTKDIVWKTADKIFRQAPAPNNLSRANDRRFEIRALAEKRFLLGYPPRKDKDTSIGDAINWEWMVDCCQRSRSNLIIVSRDNDYGCDVRDNEPRLNDWLDLEFRERTKRRARLFRTLGEAFKEVNVNLPSSAVQEEKQVQEAEHTEVSTDTWESMCLQLKERIVTLNELARQLRKDEEQK